MRAAGTQDQSNDVDLYFEKTLWSSGVGALNYKHLRYFWAVARAGGVARAAERLHVTPQSISAQVGELETALGVTLLRRAGRGLELTDTGRRVLSYADEIMSLGDELLAVVRDQGSRQARSLRVGIADSVPKSVSHRVLAPALAGDDPVGLVCREGRLAPLLGDLAVHRLDLVVADRPMPHDIAVRAFNHRLGASDVTVFGHPDLVARLDRPFPACLDGAPFLRPGDDVAIRGRLDRWLEDRGLKPRVVGEFDDSALAKAFGQGGAGLFLAPTAIADFVARQYGVAQVGRIADVVEEFYAITTERRVTHPAIVALTRAAQHGLFGSGARTARPAKRRSR